MLDTARFARLFASIALCFTAASTAACGVAVGGGTAGDDPSLQGAEQDEQTGSVTEAAKATATTTSPSFATDFRTATGFHARTGAEAQLTYGAPSTQTQDNAALEIVLAGNDAYGPSDMSGPRFASEAMTDRQTFGYGIYRTRVELARCAPGEEAVNGIFTYFNDGRDRDKNGIVDNSEIDIEVLCGAPNLISLTSWTDYEETKKGVKMNKRTRVVDTRTGKYQESPSNAAFGLVDAGQDKAFVQADFPVAGAFYEMGFDWQPTSIRYFVVLGGKEVTLWNLTDTSVIPTLPGAFHFNVWHTSEHWYSPFGAADYPRENATMRVDWFSFTAR